MTYLVMGMVAALAVIVIGFALGLVWLVRALRDPSAHEADVEMLEELKRGRRP